MKSRKLRYRPRRRLIARVRKAYLAGRMSLQEADAALAVRR